MALRACGTVHLHAIFEAHLHTPGACEIDDFLNASSMLAARNDDATQRTAGGERLFHGVNSQEQLGHRMAAQNSSMRWRVPFTGTAKGSFAARSSSRITRSSSPSPVLPASASRKG